MGGAIALLGPGVYKKANWETHGEQAVFLHGLALVYALSSCWFSSVMDYDLEITRQNKPFLSHIVFGDGHYHSNRNLKQPQSLAPENHYLPERLHILFYKPFQTWSPGGDQTFKHYQGHITLKPQHPQNIIRQIFCVMHSPQLLVFHYYDKIPEFITGKKEERFIFFLQV